MACLTWIVASLSGGLNAQDSAFEMIAKQIGNEVLLSVDKDSFRASMPSDRDKAKAVYRSLTSGLGGGSYGGSDDNWRMMAGSETSEASVLVSRGWSGRRPVQDNQQNFRVQENVSPFRSFDLLTAPDSNSISCLGQNPQNQELVFLNQVAKQPKMIVFISGPNAWSLASDSAGDFSLENSQRLSEFGAKIKELGVQSDFSNFHQELLFEIGEQITAEPVDEQEFMALIDQMESPTFTERENATKQITDSYRKWETMIAKHAVDDALNLEIRSRLQKIIDANASNMSKSAKKWIKEKSLLNDSRLVFEAWKANDDKAASKRFADHLRNLTDQKFDDNPEAWASWIDQQHQSGDLKATDMPPAMAYEESDWEFFCEEIADICSLSVSESGHLMFDQQGWLAHFDGKSPRQLRDELVASADKNNIPKSWIINGNNIDEFGPQHLLFQKLGERCYEAQYLGRKFGYSGLSLTSKQSQKFETKHLAGSLSMLPGRIRMGAVKAKDDDEFIHVQLRDPTPFGMSLDIYQDKNRFAMTLVAPAKNALIVVNESDDGFSIHDCRGRLRFSQTAKSFSDFRKNNREYFGSSLCGTLQAFCINLTKQSGNPFEFKNKPLQQLNSAEKR